MHEIVTNPWFSIPLAVLYAVAGVFFIVPPSTLGLEVGPFEPVFANEDDHWVMRVVKGVVGGNFLVGSYMLVGPPLVIECDLSNYPTWMGGKGPSGMSSGPFIFIDENLSDARRERVLRHEYQHYCQTAVLTPAVMSLAYNLNNLMLFLRYQDAWAVYLDNVFEVDARKHQQDGLQFPYFYVQIGDYGYFKPVLEVY